MPDDSTQVQPFDAGQNPPGKLWSFMEAQRQQAQPQQVTAPAPQPVTPQKQPGMVQIGAHQYPGYVDPGVFTQYETLNRDRAIEHRVYQYPDADSAKKGVGGAWKTAFLNPANAQWYSDTPDESGNNFIDPKLVDRGRPPVSKAMYSAPGSWSTQEIIDENDPDGHSTTERNNHTGEWRRPAGDKSPLPSTIKLWRVGADRGLIDYKQGLRDKYRDIQNISQAQRIYNSESNSLSNRERNEQVLAQRDPSVQYDKGVWDQRRSVLRDQYNQATAPFNEDLNKTPAIKNRDPGAAAVTFNNPGGIMSKGSFKSYPTPESGAEDLFNLIGDYQSPTGIVGGTGRVTGNSTLLEMMSQYAPKGHGKNDPQAYAGWISGQLHLPNGVNTKISDIPQADLTKKIAQFEIDGAMENPKLAALIKNYHSIIDTRAWEGGKQGVTIPPTATAPASSPSVVQPASIKRGAVPAF